MGLTWDIKYIDTIAIKYGNFSIADYLISRQRPYAVFLIDIENNQVTLTEGFDEEDLIEIPKPGHASYLKGIYALYAECHGSNSDIEVEVFMIEKQFRDTDDQEVIELITFHEVCHLIEQTGYYKELGVVLSQDELDAGFYLSHFANDINDRTMVFGEDEAHNQTFGALLYHFLKKYDPTDFRSLFRMAMSKNFGGELPPELQ